MPATAKVVLLSEWTPARSRAASRAILTVSELRQHTLSALGDLLRDHASEPRERRSAQIAEVLLELERRHQRLSGVVNDLDALARNDIWMGSPFRDPFTGLAQTMAAHIALLIGEAQMLGA